jgi:hypothetical protein
MASAELSRRVEKVVGYPPLSELSNDQRREFHEARQGMGPAERLCLSLAGLGARRRRRRRERHHKRVTISASGLWSR